MNKLSTILSWVFQIVAAAILAQTLYFKFSGHPESVKLFSELGMEPHGRVLIGILELVAVLLLIRPASAIWGAILSVGVMSGAIIGHFTHLGWHGERGQLGMLAVLVFVASLAVLAIRRKTIPFLKSVFDENVPVEAPVEEE